MPGWEYCIVYCIGRKFDVRYLTPSGFRDEHHEIPRGEAEYEVKYASIAQLGLQGWELIGGDLHTLDSPLVFKRSLEK